MATGRPESCLGPGHAYGRAGGDLHGADLGISKVFAEVLPAQNAEVVREVQQEGKPVAMV